MHESVRAIFPRYTEALEGRINHMYLDVKGLVTTGAGILIDSVASAQSLPWRVKYTTRLATSLEIEQTWRKVKRSPVGMIASRYTNDLILSEETLDQLTLQRMALTDRYLEAEFGYDQWITWPADAQLACLSLCWACGCSLGKWPKLRVACRTRDWATAAKECLIRTEGNPGVIARNKAQQLCFSNAARVDGQLFWPLHVLSTP